MKSGMLENRRSGHDKWAINRYFECSDFACLVQTRVTFDKKLKTIFPDEMLNILIYTSPFYVITYKS